MNSLEQKQKRVQFLKYLETKGIETVSKQIQRNENEIRFIQTLEKVRKRDERLKTLLNEKIPSYNEINFVGKQFFYIENVEKGDDEVFFYCNDGKIYQMYHDQESSESVYIEDIKGDMSNLIDSDILDVEVVTKPKKQSYGTSTLTSYKFKTKKGSVTIEWFGNSSGHHSESVDLRKFESKDIWRDKRLEMFGI